MRKVIFKAIKDSVMASNTHGRSTSQRETPSDSFKKDEPRLLQEETRPGPSFEPHSHRHDSAEAAARGRVLSVIGPSLVFRGELFAEEDLLIQGRVEGSINHRAMNLTIGAHGDVRADIVAQKVIIQGSVHGDVRASEAVIVEGSARVQGDLFAPHIGLKDGAKFKGTIDMDVAAPESAPQAGRGRAGGHTGAQAAGPDALGGNKVDELLDAGR